MKIRSKSELIDFLGGEKQIRKKELISLIHDLQNPKAKNIEKHCRSAIVLAYAHWEGFIKEAAKAYVRYVSSKSRKLSDLSTNFQAMACRQDLIIAQGATRKIEPHMSVIRRFTDDFSKSVSINPDDAINTESNLNSEVFENICASVGIDYNSCWAIDGPFIDDLFSNRCAIAHGELQNPKREYAIESLNFIINAIDKFSTEIENAAIQEHFLRKTDNVQQSAQPDCGKIGGAKAANLCGAAG